MARKITVFSTKTNKSSSITSSSSTWGELREEISSLLNEAMVATVAQTKNQLVIAEAILPEGEFTLVLTPAQAKGAAETIDIASVIAELKQKFDDAFEEVLESIENGDHSSGDSSDSSVREQAEEIRRALGV